ncbi:Argininosuccinate lyase [Candidatus Gugararchaeum adminiculabundum]|nr:Argininosuccinate lyase [Candidatus Gugararchaeum adminiculabundum]
MLWGGRFSDEPDKLLLEFMSSENLAYDARLIPYDLMGNKAHSTMLCEQGILKPAEAAEILKALAKLEEEFKKGKLQLKLENEDVHLNIESLATKLTEHAKKMHTARSRNDQVAVDTRMYLRDATLASISAILSLAKTFQKISQSNLGTIMPAYTHTRVAQPITVAFYFDAQTKQLLRTVQRLEQAFSRLNQNPLGSCAGTGTSWDISRTRTAELLGFEGVQENALDAVSSRGELEAELTFALSQLMVQLSRISEDFIFYSEKGFVSLSDKYTTGSSIMPQKKNPDALEIIRSRAARVQSSLFLILTAIKNTPTGHNADSQETKFAAMNAFDTAIPSAKILEAVLSTAKFDEKKMIHELDAKFANATDLADLLVQEGTPFREAHAKVGELVKECEIANCTLSSLKGKSVHQVVDIKESVEIKKNGANQSNVSRLLKQNDSLIFKHSEFVKEKQAKLEAAEKLLETAVKKITKA